MSSYILRDRNLRLRCSAFGCSAFGVRCPIETRENSGQTDRYAVKQIDLGIFAIFIIAKQKKILVFFYERQLNFGNHFS